MALREAKEREAFASFFAVAAGASSAVLVCNQEPDRLDLMGMFG